MNLEYTLSPWGAVVIVTLAIAVAGLFWLFDRSVFIRLLKALGLLLFELALASVFVWVFYRFDNWWADVVWLLLAAGGASIAAYNKAHLHDRQYMLTLFLALLTGGAVLGFCMLLSLKTMPARLMIVSVTAVLMTMLTGSVASAFQTFESSLRHTKSHRQYLLANGATLFESLVPSYRRALRAAVLSQRENASFPLLGFVPLFMGGMLIGGVPPLSALAVSALFVLAVFVASVIATIVIFILQYNQISR